MLFLIIKADLRSREDLTWLGDLTIDPCRRRAGPSIPSFLMIGPKKGLSVYMNIEGLDKSFHLSCKFCWQIQVKLWVPC